MMAERNGWYLRLYHIVSGSPIAVASRHGPIDSRAYSTPLEAYVRNIQHIGRNGHGILQILVGEVPERPAFLDELTAHVEVGRDAHGSGVGPRRLA